MRYVRAVLSLAALAATAGVARADIVNLGTFSLDEFVPGAINGFTVVNYTAAFSLPPDFPVLNSIVFKDASVTLTQEDGTVLAPIPIGDLGPGGSNPASLQFLNTDLFRSAEFVATLNVLTFNLDGGTSFVADTSTIDALLLPSSGSTLVAGVDIVPITVTGNPLALPVPEPEGWLLLVTMLTVLVAIEKFASARRDKGTAG